MIREMYQTVKLSTKDNNVLYAAVVGVVENKIYRVKVLKQPIYELATTKNAATLFKQFCHSDFEIDFLPLEYKSEEMTITVHENMMDSLLHNEKVDLLKYFNHTLFGETTDNKTARDVRKEKNIINELLDSVYIVST